MHTELKISKNIVTSFLHQGKQTKIPHYIEETIVIDKSVKLNTPYNYTDLMKAVGWSPTTGINRKNQLAKLKYAMDYGMKGRRYVVYKVFSEALPLPVHRSHLNIDLFTIKLLDSFIEEFGLPDENEVTIVSLPVYKIPMLLGLVNETYSYKKAGLSPKENWDWTTNPFKTIPRWHVEKLFRISYEKVRDLSNSVLKNIEDKSLVYTTEVYEVKLVDSDTKREATIEEETFIASTYNRVLAELEELENKKLTLGDVLFKGAHYKQDFYDRVDEILLEEYGIDDYMKHYKFAYDKYLPVARERLAKRIKTSLETNGGKLIIDYCKTHIRKKAKKVTLELFKEKNEKGSSDNKKRKFDLDLTDIREDYDYKYLDEDFLTTYIDEWAKEVIYW